MTDQEPGRPTRILPALPIDPRLPEIVSVLRKYRRAVLVAPPGAGKTTRVAPALIEEGPVILLQPRRVAARSIAARIASEQGWEIGREVGWQVRFERRFGRETRLLVCTEGILTNRLQADPLLTGFRTAILDEFHERSVHADVALALMREAVRARDDLQLLVMSATLDARAVSDYLDGCPMIEVEGRAHPVEIGYAPHTFPQSAITERLDQPGGHILCFLPGAGEISRLGEDLRARARPGVAILPLHGTLEAAAQDRALAPSRERKVILATNIAETSLTVEGVTDVIDTGLHKVLRYDSRRGIDSLELERIPADSAEQRAGRAGRLGPGRALRLWDPRERLRPHREADIRRIDLAAPFLDVIAWGGDPLSLDWYEAPARERAESALELLDRLGLVRDGRLTPLGDIAHRLPLHPRLACILVSAGGSRRAAAVCALLSERGQSHPALHATDSDILTLADEIDIAPPPVRNVALEIERVGRSLLGRGVKTDPSEESLLRSILAGFPDRVAQRREPRSARLLLASGHGARLTADSGVWDGEYLVALDVIGSEARGVSEALVRQASRIEKQWLRPTCVEVRHWFDPETRAVKAVEQVRYMALLLAERPVPPHPDESIDLLLGAWAKEPLDEASRTLVARARMAGVSIDMEAARRAACAGRVSLPRLDLHLSLSHAERQLLDRLCPESVRVPSGRSIRLEYGDDGIVRLSVKLQELFGLEEGPRVGRNQEPVLIHLLAPNGRPVQTTTDLRSFWQRTYPEVRRELRGRYPKHPWPEDPAGAEPTARVKKRVSGRVSGT